MPGVLAAPVSPILAYRRELELIWRGRSLLLARLGRHTLPIGTGLCFLYGMARGSLHRWTFQNRLGSGPPIFTRRR